MSLRDSKVIDLPVNDNIEDSGSPSIKKKKKAIKQSQNEIKRKDSFGKNLPTFNNNSNNNNSGVNNDNEKKEEETQNLPKEKKKEKEEKKIDEKKELIKEEKKLEKKKEKEEKKREKEEEKRKEKEEKLREKEEKKSAEQKRALRKERRKSLLKQGDKGMENIDLTAQSIAAEEKDSNWIPKAKPPFACPEVMHTQRELEQFLLNIPMKKLRGTTWTYYDIAPASGYKETLIVLHSGGIRPEVMFEHILGFAQHFRVIAPFFPEYFNEIADYPAGLSLIMRHENIKKAHFFGIGFGAVVANYFLYKHQNRVVTLTLVHSTLPLETKKKACEKALKKVDFCYGPMHRILSGNSVKPKELEEHVLDLLPGEKDLWMRNFKKFSATKQALIVRTEALLDYHTNVVYHPEDFDRWQGKVFLIESEDDEYFDKEGFEQLKALFPNTYVHYISGSGHLQLLIRGQFVVDLVLKFIFDDETLTSRTDLSKNEGTADTLHSDIEVEIKNSNDNKGKDDKNQHSDSSEEEKKEDKN